MPKIEYRKDVSGMQILKVAQLWGNIAVLKQKWRTFSWKRRKNMP
jgi:hypothetical protein